MSDFAILRMALPIILLAVSQMPIGQTPGFLSSGVRRQLTKPVRPIGSTNSVEILRASKARELQRSLEGPWNLVHNLL